MMKKNQIGGSLLQGMAGESRWDETVLHCSEQTVCTPTVVKQYKSLFGEFPSPNTPMEGCDNK